MNNGAVSLILISVSGYFSGSIPTAYLIARSVKGIDIRKVGSGNAGATNVFRVVGKKWGIGVLIFDALKGAFAVCVLPILFPEVGLNPFMVSLAAGLSAIAGHTWSVWLRFRGGKGVATSAGVFIALAPKPALAALVFWALLFTWKRYVSLASLGTAACFPLWVLVFYSKTDRFPVLFPISLLLAAFIFYTHRGNIVRLRSGTEKRLL